MKAWGLLFAAGLVLEIRALRGRGVTLTSTTRHVFRTQNRIGRAAFIAACAWFAVHILHKRSPRSL